jgi:hypothetical protein
MSAPAYSWDTVINSITTAIQSVLTELGNQITANAQMIAKVLVGLAIVGGVAYGVYRVLPAITRFLRAFRL